MVDPISEEELKRSRRIKQYQQYESHLDELDKSDKTQSTPIGEMQGKKVKKIASENSPTGEIFDRYLKDNPQVPDSQK